MPPYLFRTEMKKGQQANKGCHSIKLYTSRKPLVGSSAFVSFKHWAGARGQLKRAPSKLLFSRPCDSRNLNLSPLCTLKNGSLPKIWLPAVIFWSYAHLWTWTGKRNLQSTWCSRQIPYPGEGDLQQNSGTILHLLLGQPYEDEAQGWPSCHKDHGQSSFMQIMRSNFPSLLSLSGERLQRLGGGHCCCQHLFWQGNCHG